MNRSLKSLRVAVLMLCVAMFLVICLLRVLAGYQPFIFHIALHDRLIAVWPIAPSDPGLQGIRVWKIDGWRYSQGAHLYFDQSADTFFSAFPTHPTTSWSFAGLDGGTDFVQTYIDGNLQAITPAPDTNPHPGITSSPPMRASNVYLPNWLLLAASGFLPLTVLLRQSARFYNKKRARLRSRNRQCPECGYDLRASYNQCPECGRAISD